MGRAAEVLVLGAAPILLLAGLLAKAPIAQFPGYHDFADQRTLLGIPHFWNVVSNLPFVLIGAMGLALLRSRPPGVTAAWAVLFGATVLIGFGSAFYHLVPDNTTLIWDRLPIGIAFMAFLVALVAEHSTQPGARILLLPLALFATGAVFWWRYTGDLSLWVWVQLAPMLVAALALCFLAGRYTHRRYLLYALLCYAAAKAGEFADHSLMQWSGGALSGHTLKHLGAAAGVAFLYVMLRRRTATR